jgi:hypothetical protein
MSEQRRDLKPKTKAFAPHIIRMYSALPGSDPAAIFTTTDKRSMEGS